MNTATLSNYYTETAEGYLGAIKTIGSKSHKYLHGAELSREVKKSLQDILTDLKRSQISTKIQTYTGGQHLTITLKLQREKYGATVEEYKEKVRQKVDSNRYNWIYTVNNDKIENIHSSKYWDMTAEERKIAQDTTADQMTKFDYEPNSKTINYYHIDEEDTLNAIGLQIVKAANQIIKAYNYDDSNAMVDYFDTNFYYDIKIQWV